jgi:hypothetical protein
MILKPPFQFVPQTSIFSLPLPAEKPTSEAFESDIPKDPSPSCPITGFAASDRKPLPNLSHSILPTTVSKENVLYLISEKTQISKAPNKLT